MHAVRLGLAEDRSRSVSGDFELLVAAVLKRFGMTVISDRLTQRALLPLLEGLLDAVKTGEFTLSSGAKSDFYIDARLVTLNPALMPYVGHVVLERARNLAVTCVGGPATASIPMTSAAATLSAMDSAHQWIVKTFYVRPEAKKHGTKTLAEGLVPSAGERVLLVDDVLTSGGSILRAAQAVRELGGVVAGAIVLVDREEGGREKLLEEGIEAHGVYCKSELLPLKKAMEELSRGASALFKGTEP